MRTAIIAITIIAIRMFLGDVPKAAAKCDNRCELQTSVNQWPIERALRSWAMPEGTFASVLLILHVSYCSLPLRAVLLHAACYCTAALACSISCFAHWFD